MTAPVPADLQLPPSTAARRDPLEWDDPRAIEAFDLDKVEFRAPHDSED